MIKTLAALGLTAALALSPMAGFAQNAPPADTTPPAGAPPADTTPPAGEPPATHHHHHHHHMKHKMHHMEHKHHMKHKMKKMEKEAEPPKS
jgi:hypothetical protein